MTAVAVRDLQEQASEIVRRVRDEHESIDVTEDGKVVARLVPVPDAIDIAAREAIWDEFDRLAIEISKYWPEGLSAADAVAEERE